MLIVSEKDLVSESETDLTSNVHAAYVLKDGEQDSDFS